MKISALVSSVALASVAVAAVVTNIQDDASDEQNANDIMESIRADVLKTLDDREAKLRKRGEEASCHARNVVFRRE